MKRSHRIGLPPDDYMVVSAEESPIELIYCKNRCLVRSADTATGDWFTTRFLDDLKDRRTWTWRGGGWVVTREAGAYLEAVAHVWDIAVNPREVATEAETVSTLPNWLFDESGWGSPE